MENDPIFKLLDFKVGNKRRKGPKRPSEFTVQMFGIDEAGKSHSLLATGFEPFFYVKVGDCWGKAQRQSFLADIQKSLAEDELRQKFKDQMRTGNDIYPALLEDETLTDYVRRCADDHKSYHGKAITDCRIISRETLYGFDAGKNHTFVLLRFTNTTAMNKVRNLWYNIVNDRESLFGKRYILRTFASGECETELYEAKLPPLLRLFHIKLISPSGWIQLPREEIESSCHLGRKYIGRCNKPATFCDYEYTVDYRSIIPLSDKETAVPCKVCSFDIEASSSHGDFPVAIKTYRKFVGEIVTYWQKHFKKIRHLDANEQKALLVRLVLTAFSYDDIPSISLVYPKAKVSRQVIMDKTQTLLDMPLSKMIESGKPTKEYRLRDDSDDDEIHATNQQWGHYIRKAATVLDYLNDDKFDASKKLDILDEGLKVVLPPLEGDKATFIGSTFLRSGETLPYLNHCVVLNTCDAVPIEGSESIIEAYDTEHDLLMGWAQMMRREQPDVIIGYNIFGFDWKFLCQRARENNCYRPPRRGWGQSLEEGEADDWFVGLLGRNRDTLSKKVDKSIRIASGTHELTYLKMDGVIQIDLYNHFRREVNLSSYKLGDVAAHFIGDFVSSATTEPDDGRTLITSKNLIGLQKGNFVCFEIIGHSSDRYENGKKFMVTHIDEDGGKFWVDGRVIMESGKKLRWGLGKDDVTPQDIFRLTQGSSSDRAIIAKYCFQDCNLVHHLFRKNDILTGMAELATICSVPIDYIVMRGQGIKLLSFIAKKCRDAKTLMPVIERSTSDGSYEGAICLKPKRAFYVDDPVAVVDYAALYPSSMISENISHDSKVWTKEYDLSGQLIIETGSGEYDNLAGWEYVDVEYDRYEWRAPPGRKKEEKVKIGTKICRFAQFPDGKKAIMPRILQELLAARKATRAKIKYKTVNRSDGSSVSGTLKELDDKYEITQWDATDGKLSKTKTTVLKTDVVGEVNSTFTAFMKNVFDKRQAGLKVTANSLYGQCGARTSAFYEMDIAASTTATGRKLLLYAQRIIEDVYKDTLCETSYGRVRTRAEYIYGDTDSVFFTFHLEDEQGEKILGKRALEMTIELAQEAGKLASKFLKAPHDLEYEKTFHPFLLLSKKRYVGLLYETDPNKCKRKSMGIVLKRRDNAPIVKDVYGGIIDILMHQKNVAAAVEFTKECLENMVAERYPLEKLIVSKSLRGWYKNPDSIAHRVLADRMGKRDPGNKPSIGSRIPYVYIQTKKKVKLQGNRIETPSYVRANNLKPDYGFYITNQIMKPVQQVFALILEQIPSFRNRKKFHDDVRRLRHRLTEEKAEEAEKKLRNSLVKKLVFEDALRCASNNKAGQRSIMSFFGE